MICTVILKKGSQINQNELLSYAQEKLGAYSPKFVVILKKTPRNNQGKILKNELESIVKTILPRMISR